MKKIILSILVIISICISSVSAYVIIGDLSYWYSDYDGIGTWSSSPTYAKYETDNCPTSFLLNVSTGFSAWDSAGVSNSYQSDFSSANIKVYGGPFDELNVLYPAFPDDDRGYTAISTYDSGAYYTTPSGNKKAYVIVSANVYYATDRATSKTYKHEAGHSLGWYGHSSNSSDVMYYNSSSVTSLTTRDKNHLNQVY